MKTIVFMMVCFFSPLLYSQQCFVSLEIKETDANRGIIECWKGYLQSRPDSLYDNPYWNDTDKQTYKSYDLLASEGFLSPSLYGLFLRGFSNIILQIEPMGDAAVIHSMFYRILADGGIYPLATVKVIARKDATGVYKLHNWTAHHTRNWNRRRVGAIQYIYPPSHPFNQYKAEKANRLIHSLVKTFGIEVDHVDYYIASSCPEIFKLKGFDDVVGMYCLECNSLCGFTDRINKIIYANSIEGEFYAHELMRLMVEFFPHTEGVFLNGLAAYIGGDYKVGLPMTEHFVRMDRYLKEHPEVRLDHLYSWEYMDETTNPSYYLGVLICHLCLEKGGLPLLRKGMEVDATDEQAIYVFLEQELGLSRKKLNQELRKKIHEVALKGFQAIDFLAPE